MEISGDKIMAKLDKLEIDVNKISMELQDHKERHKMIVDVVITFGKLIMGIAGFFTLIGGAIFGFYKFIKGGV